MVEGVVRRWKCVECKIVFLKECGWDGGGCNYFYEGLKIVLI